ncbi:hypothetical protein THRCLA_01626 [Thraustotheca clavata]|uniref:Uncharacterized protein n=1 Tax=Thraustotheca clavata TaxID=74557 RepID=A0A1W0A808_9STRA|nr:hypothetical protein THRCLA_01626 [Thraustotheca clavata]
MNTSPPSDKLCKHHDMTAPVSPQEVLTTAFEPSQLQSEAEAFTISAEMGVDFYSDVSVLYNLTSDFCGKKTEEVATMDILIHRLDAHVRDEDALRDIEKVRNMYHGMLHVYVYLYRVHWHHFVQLDMSGHLTLCWKRLMAFAAEYRVLDASVLHKVYDFIMSIIEH